MWLDSGNSESDDRRPTLTLQLKIDCNGAVYIVVWESLVYVGEVTNPNKDLTSHNWQKEQYIKFLCKFDNTKDLSNWLGQPLLKR